MSSLTPDEQSTWLAPPGPNIALNAKQVSSTRRSITIARNAAASTDQHQLRRVLLAEAQASSYIEGVNDDTTTGGTISNLLHQAPLPPADHADFGRCLLLIGAVPEASRGLDILALHDPRWDFLRDHWQLLGSVYIQK